MNESATMFRVLSARRTALPLAALLALGGAVQAQTHDRTMQDPTRPATARAATQIAAPGALQVEAIMGDGAQRVAIVNGKVVRAGDRIGATLIEEIHSDSIRYTRDGRSIVANIAKAGMQVRKTASAGEEK
jgi:hypothetical protein